VDARVNQGVYKIVSTGVIGIKQHEIITVRETVQGWASPMLVIDGVQSVFGPGLLGLSGLSMDKMR